MLVADLDGEAAAVESLHQVAELLHREVAAEDVVARGAHQLLEHRAVVAVLPGLELDLARGGRGQRGQVADARHRLALPGAQRPAQRAGGEVLVVRGGQPDRDAAALIDLRMAARDMRELGDDLLHEAGDGDRDRHVVERHALLLGDGDLVVEGARVVGADLRAEAVLERRDDAAAVGVVLGVRGRDHEHVERQAQPVAADLHVALFDDVEQTDLDALGEVGQLVDREDAAVGARDQPVVDGQLVAEVAPLGDPDGVDLADQVGDRRVRGGELLRVALIGSEPRQLGRVAVLGDEVAAATADRRVRIVVDLAAGDGRDRVVEEA